MVTRQCEYDVNFVFLTSFCTAFSPVPSEKGSASTRTLTPESLMLRIMTPSPTKSRSTSPTKPNTLPSQTVPTKTDEIQANTDINGTEVKHDTEPTPTAAKPQLKSKPTTIIKKEKKMPVRERDHTHKKPLPTDSALDPSAETTNKESKETGDSTDNVTPISDTQLDNETEQEEKADEKLDSVSDILPVADEERTEDNEIELGGFEDIDSCLATSSAGTETVKLDTDIQSPTKSSEHEFTFVTTLSNYDIDKREEIKDGDQDDLERSRSPEGNHGNMGLVP